MLGIGALIDGHYRLDAEIGRGGMGIVYRARDIPHARDVAIKVINLEKLNSLTRQQFSRETEIAGRLQHPHIVAVYETGLVDPGGEEPSPYIVMEFVQGKSLDELHGLTYARIIDIAKQICDALEYAHNQGFVYRDLKPGNILVEKHGFQYFVKLVDFGLARVLGMANLDSESNIAGTIFYLAPELIAGEPADIRSDLYALGATMYEMITGRVPFSDFDEKTVLSQHLEASVPPPSQSRDDIPLALEAIVLRLLAKNPKDRFASAQEVNYALEQITVTREYGVASNNLPQPTMELIGRQTDVAQVQRVLESNQLVTILGDCETLALGVGSQLSDQFSDGVWWVELGSFADPALVLQSVASVLGIPQDSRHSLTVSLIQYLREKDLLILFTRCDRVRSACAQLAETILSTCPDVRILATSHEPLGIPAEKSIRVAI